MELKKGYKRTDVGIIPNDWKVLLLNDLAVKIGSGITPTGGASVYKQEGRPLVRSQNVGWGNLLLDDVAYIDDEIHQTFPNTEIILNDVFLNITGASIGRSSYANEELVGGNVNQHVCIIRTVDRALNPLFLNLFLLSKNGQRQIDSFQSGGNRQGLNIGQIKTFQIPVPYFEEQTAIATALSDAEALITSLEKLIAKKRNIKQGAMQELLKPKKDWVQKNLVEVVDYIHGKAHEQQIVENGKYVVVNSKFVSTEGIVVKYSNVNYCPAKVGDVLTVLSDLPNGKALAKCFFIDINNKYAVNQRICIWRTKGADSRFLFFLLNRNRYFLSLDDGVSQTHILNKHIEACKIYLPTDLSIQKKIGDILLGMDTEIRALDSKLLKVKMLKQGMMQNLLTGKIRLIANK